MNLRNLGIKLFGGASGRRVREAVREGTVEVPGGTVWYRLVGPNEHSEDSGAKAALPLVLVHGGPGFPHPYLKPLEALATNRAVLLYDQLGCGRSSRPNQEWCWSVPRYVAELEALVQHVGFERFHLLGHSWGAVVAYEYGAEYPDRLGSLIYASPALNIPQWRADAQRLRQSLSEEQCAALARGEAQGTTLDAEYQRALEEYYRQFIYRLNPLPEEINASAAGFGEAAYFQMWGPNEALVSGTLREYDASPGLGALCKPTLFTCGRFDEATPEACRALADNVPGAELSVFEQSAHLPHLSERELYVQVVRGFLERAERETGVGTRQ